MESEKPSPSVPPEPAQGLPTIYFNGFEMHLGTTDITITFILNRKRIQQANVSYTMAKTLAEKLNGLVNHIEKNSNQPILSSDAVAGILKEKD